MPAMTFGYGRAEVVAALVNYTTLIVIGLYLVYEAVLRFLRRPASTAGWWSGSRRWRWRSTWSPRC